MSDSGERIDALRDWLRDRKLDAWLVPHEDEYLNEYTPAHYDRLKWLTGFTGSAGAALIGLEKSAMFVDGRYTVQVREQVSGDLFEYCHLIEEPPTQWAVNNLAEGSRIGFDSRCGSAAWHKRALGIADGQVTLVSLSENPIDSLWNDRPALDLSNATLLETERAGSSSADKRTKIAEALRKQHADATLVTQPDSIAWLLNIRGNDIPGLPVVLSHLILHADGCVEFFVDPSRLPEGFAEHVGDCLQVKKPAELEDSLRSLAGKRVLFDPAVTNIWARQHLESGGAELHEGASPCLLPKAIKNETEIAGMRASHVRDGVAVSKFLAWLDREVEAGTTLDEALVSDKLWEFRSLEPKCTDNSFSTISAAGPNAALCHYNHRNNATPHPLVMNSVYLVDSGGQYVDGTTDITRTVAIGNPGPEVRRLNTLVLKGHISLASARFPKGTKGVELDSFARQHLWAEGFDFDHGTGHGVGHILAVHEGPHSISKKPVDAAMHAGMVVSNEPGYYRAGAFGIRIENVELCIEKESEGDAPVLCFEPLTRVPMDRRLVDVTLLTSDEIAWWNDYHGKVFEAIAPSLDGDDLKWLEQATAPIETENTAYTDALIEERV